MFYPVYYDAYINGVIRAYQEARKDIRNAVSFVFLTDVHIYKNGRCSVPLIEKIGRETDISTVLCGGDFVWAFGSRQMCIDQIILSMEYMDPIRESMRLYMARGNHDATIRRSPEDETGYTMPYAQVRALFAEHNSQPTSRPEGKLYFYADDPECRTRYIVLDTCEPQLGEDASWGVGCGMFDTQLHWLCEQALRFANSEGWSVVVMGHVPCSPVNPGYSDKLQPLAQILEAFQNRTVCAYGDFTDNRAKLLAYVCGHNHKDSSGWQNGVLHISTGCDAYCIDDGMPRDVGTTDSVLFDIFLMDTDTGAVQSFRVGAGKDRVFKKP